MSILPEGSWAVLKIAEGEHGERFGIMYVDGGGKAANYLWSGPSGRFTEQELRDELSSRGASPALVESCLDRARAHWNGNHHD